MNDPVKNLLSNIANLKTEAPASRVVVILHPNTSRIDITLNDRVFNNERYCSSRQKEPQGPEKILLDTISYIIGIDEVKAGKNTMHLEIADGMKHREFIPQVLVALYEWGRAINAQHDEPTPYNPEVHVEDRRWKVEPIDGEWHTIKPGVRMEPGEANIGVPYTPWTEN